MRVTVCTQKSYLVKDTGMKHQYLKCRSLENADLNFSLRLRSMNAKLHMVHTMGDVSIKIDISCF